MPGQRLLINGGCWRARRLLPARFGVNADEILMTNDVHSKAPIRKTLRSATGASAAANKQRSCHHHYTY